MTTLEWKQQHEGTPWCENRSSSSLLQTLGNKVPTLGQLLKLLILVHSSYSKCKNNQSSIFIIEWNQYLIANLNSIFLFTYIFEDFSISNCLAIEFTKLYLFTRSIGFTFVLENNAILNFPLEHCKFTTSKVTLNFMA